MVAYETNIIMYPRYRERPLSTIEPYDLTVWFGGGILNPMRPTLTAIALEELGTITQYKIIHIMLNPFTQWAKEVGELTLGIECTYQGGFEPLLSLIWGSCPSLLLPQKILSEDFCREIYAQLMRACGNGQKLLEGVRKYPNNPIVRINAELERCQETGKLLPDGQLTEAEAMELATLLLNKEAVNAEIEGFIELWKASIELLQGNGQAQNPMSLLNFFFLFSGLRESCKF